MQRIKLRCPGETPEASLHLDSAGPISVKPADDLTTWPFIEAIDATLTVSLPEKTIPTPLRAPNTPR